MRRQMFSSGNNPVPWRIRGLASRLLPVACCLLGFALPAGDDLPFLFSGTGEAVPAAVDAVCAKGLNWLQKTQNAKGSWNDNYGGQEGVVGLAVLAMLSHGDDPNYGTYSVGIRKGLTFILERGQAQDGLLGSSMYNHGFATLALAEAYGMVHDERLGPALEKAVTWVLRAQAQNPAGAWRYNVVSRDADTTVSGACLVALYAARNAGIQVPKKALDKALDFYRSCQDESGGFGYTAAGDANLTRTSIGTLVLALSRERKQELRAAAGYLKQHAEEPSYGGIQNRYYFIYYYSQALFQAQPDRWELWNKAHIRELLASQVADGSWSSEMGATFSTACAVLSLALNYRYLPIYER